MTAGTPAPRAGPVVYKARDIQLKRWVALKFLPSNLATSDELRERFLIEAQAAAALSHPNICVIHEVGEDQGLPFIAMEYVEGETLRQKIKRGLLGTEDVVALMGQVAAGLGEAHSKGIIHRDIKSSNVMVTDKGQAKVMDFGLAKLHGGESLTKTQTTLGTVGFMSPEQASGAEVDHRTDLWSAGVVFYELLTGEMPFQGPNDLAVIYNILNEEPRPIQRREPPVPAALQRVVDRVLKKDPEARYGSAGEMVEDLQKYSETLRAEAAGVLNLRSLVRRLRQPRVAVPTALAFAAVAAVAVWFFQHRAEVVWAREVALPEIERLIGENDAWRNLVPPYRLAEQAEAILGDDPTLADVFSRVALEMDVRTTPPGARVYMKEFANPDAEWTYLGVSPLEGTRVPVGIFRWKIEKDRYETSLAASSTWDFDPSVQTRQGIGIGLVPYQLVRTLDWEGDLPPRMVRVQSTETPVGTLDDFFIGKYEVTNREYKQFVDAGGYRNGEYWQYPFLKDGVELTWDEAIQEFVDPSGQPGPSTWMGGDYPPGRDEYPVSGVSWYEAAAYAEYAAASLPTDVHWNVARGGFTPMIRYPQLGGFAVLAPFSNFGGQGPVPVGSLPGITTYGAYDMAGNVREWCWNETPQGRLIRGGAWDGNTYDFNGRRQAPPMDRSATNGFRLAVYPETVPEAAFAFRRLSVPTDLRAQQLVSDDVFEIYREQFAYDETPLNARVESREESPGGWIREKVFFDAAYGGERVTAYLFLPANTPPPFQTVVYFPGSASAWTASSEDLESYYEFPMFLSYLLRSGRAVLYPIYKGTFERQVPGMPPPLLQNTSHQYSEYLIQVVRDFRRSVDYLETREDIDSGKLAYYGMSWGGILGAIIPAVEERLATSVLLAGLLIEAGRPEVYPLNYVTRVRTPTLMLNGKYDVGIDAGIKPMFDLLGTPAEHKRLILYDTDHIPPRSEFIKETLAWLDKYLGPVDK
jgi:tRNA A-37 threonylcarbamoyl transferase component Bud32/dienelactone hydrolase